MTVTDGNGCHAMQKPLNLLVAATRFKNQKIVTPEGGAVRAAVAGETGLWKNRLASLPVQFLEA